MEAAQIKRKVEVEERFSRFVGKAWVDSGNREHEERRPHDQPAGERCEDTRLHRGRGENGREGQREEDVARAEGESTAPINDAVAEARVEKKRRCENRGGEKELGADVRQLLQEERSEEAKC